jgi:hypothetical protein
VSRWARLVRDPRTALVALCLGAFAYFYQAGGWNQNVRFDLVRAVVEDGSLRIDRFARNTGDLARRDGHYYCDKAPGVSWLGVPPYALSRLVAPEPATPRYLAWTSWLATVVAIAVPSALAVAFLFSLVRALCVRVAPAAACAAGWGLATLAWPYSTVFYGHQLVAALLVIAFAILVEIRRRGDAPTPVRLAVAGALLGFAVVVEYPSALAGAAVGIYGVVVARRRSGWLIAGGIAPVLTLLVYHAAAFGGPLTLPYEFSTQPHRHMGWFMGLGAPAPKALWGILVSDYRGLFYSAPWLLLAIPGAVRLARRGFVAEVIVCAAAFLLFVWLNASLVDWQGGWAMGPRYLVPAIPFLVILASGVALPGAAITRVQRRAAWIAVGIALSFSAFLMLVGTAVKPEVPTHIKRPFQQYLLQRFYAGDLAVSTQSIDMPNHPDRGPRHAWNLGHAIGLRGHASLIPLAVWLALSGALLVRSVRRS